MIKVRLNPEQGIKVKLSPSQSPDVDLKTVYLYDDDWIPAINNAITDAHNYAESAKESEQNAAQSASDADADATNAAESATIAYNSEQNAIAQANKATEEANAAAESAYQAQTSALAAYEYASNAEADAQNALETLGHVLESETISTNAANTATQKAQEASESAADAQESAEEAQRIKDSLGNIYVFKGSVATFEDLPTNASVGDVYDVLDTGKNYAWDGSKWDDIGGTVDLSAYAKTSYVDGREQAIREDYMQADSDLQTQINGQATAITEAQGDIVDLQNNKQAVISDLDTIRSGAGKGATAVQPNDLSTVATSGSYNDLTNKPTIPTVNNGTLTIQKNGVQVATFSANQSGNVTANIEADTQVNADWNATSGVAQILNKPTLSAVAKSGSYNDLSNKPTIPTTPSQVGALPDTTKYGADLSYSDDKFQLLDQDGNAIGSSVEITGGGSGGMPSDRYIDLTLGVSGAPYTAPANGWFCVGGYNDSAGTGSVTIRTSLLRVVSNATANEWGCGCILPVKKDDIVYIDYKNITTWLNKKFVYAEGEI